MARILKGAINDSNPVFLPLLTRGQAGQDLFVVSMTQGKTHGTWLELGAWHPIEGNNTYLLETRYNWSGVSIDIDDQSQGCVSVLERIWQENYKPGWPEKITGVDNLTDTQLQQVRAQYLDLWIKETVNHIDHIPQNQRCWKNIRPRTNFLQVDALSYDHTNLPPHIDYLQVDIDPVSANLEMLTRLIDQHEFSVITFEHDAYAGGADNAQARALSRRMLLDQGYELIAGDVAIMPYLMEDPSLSPFCFEDWWVHPRYIKRNIIETYQTSAPGLCWDQILLQD